MAIYARMRYALIRLIMIHQHTTVNPSRACNTTREYRVIHKVVPRTCHLEDGGRRGDAARTEGRDRGSHAEESRVVVIVIRGFGARCFHRRRFIIILRRAISHDDADVGVTDRSICADRAAAFFFC